MRGVTEFSGDDEGYVEWLGEHSAGFVLNAYSKPSAAYLVLHRASCRTIGGQPTRGSRWTFDYLKVCADDKNDLVQWCVQEVGTEPVACQVCAP